MRPLLLGMNNPLSDNPKYDLYPYPEKSAGWRLWMLTGLPKADYLAAFDRRNLLRAREWDNAAARKAGALLLPELNGRLVVVLGTQVRAALGLEQSEPLARHEYAVGKVHFVWIAFPHPSGRNRWFNDPANLKAAAKCLTDLLE